MAVSSQAEAWDTCFPNRPQEGSGPDDTLMWTSILQNWETICLIVSHPLCGVCYDGLSKLLHMFKESACGCWLYGRAIYWIFIALSFWHMVRFDFLFFWGWGWSHIIFGDERWADMTFELQGDTSQATTWSLLLLPWQLAASQMMKAVLSVKGAWNRGSAWFMMHMECEDEITCAILNYYCLGVVCNCNQTEFILSKSLGGHRVCSQGL